MPPMFLFIGDIGSLSSGYIYIGLKKGGDGNFYWVDGSRLTLPFWDSGEPDAGPGNCGMFLERRREKLLPNGATVELLTP